MSKADAVSALMPTADEIERAATAVKLADELLWFNGDWGFVLSGREHAFVHNILESSRVLTQSEWEWLCEIELRYAKLRAAAGVEGPA